MPPVNGALCHAYTHTDTCIHACMHALYTRAYMQYTCLKSYPSTCAHLHTHSSAAKPATQVHTHSNTCTTRITHMHNTHAHLGRRRISFWPRLCNALIRRLPLLVLGNALIQ